MLEGLPAVQMRYWMSDERLMTADRIADPGARLYIERSGLRPQRHGSGSNAQRVPFSSAALRCLHRDPESNRELHPLRPSCPRTGRSASHRQLPVRNDAMRADSTSILPTDSRQFARCRCGLRHSPGQSTIAHWPADDEDPDSCDKTRSSLTSMAGRKRISPGAAVPEIWRGGGEKEDASRPHRGSEDEVGAC